MFSIYPDNILITTKWNKPFSGARLVKRKRLFEKLEQYRQYKLILVTAPAGYGKTALLSSWISGGRKGSRVSWLSLDKDDDETELFFSYFLHSFYHQAGQKEAGGKTGDIIQAGTAFNRLYLIRLMRDAAVRKEHFIMVLDNFEVIQNAAILEELRFMLGHMPDNLHLILSGRRIPKLQLARMRVSEAVLSINYEMIKFTPEETALFFRDNVHRRLTPSQCADLQQGFEGWAAGMQIMALAMRNEGEEGVSELAGNKMLFRYLMEEVYTGLREDIKSFLLCTCVLDRFCPGLCDCLAGLEESRRLIQEIQDLNLFIICLDREDEWYSYHPLFRDFLKGLLTDGEEAVRQSFFREAALWHEANHYLKEAVDYAIRGHDYTKAVSLIEEHGKELGHMGRSALLKQWNQALPEEVVRDNPRLILNGAWAASAGGKREEALAAIDRLRGFEPLTTGKQAEIIALASSNVTGSSLKAGHILQECKRILQQLPRKEFLPELICFNMAGILLQQGRIPESMEYFKRCCQESLESGNLYLAITSGKAIITSKIREGKLKEAQRESLRLLSAAGGHSGGVLPAAGLLYALLAEIYYQWNELSEAMKMALKGEEYGALGSDIWVMEENALVLEKIYKALGMRAEYEDIKKKACEGLEGRELFDISLRAECLHTEAMIDEGKLTAASGRIVRMEAAYAPEIMAAYPEIIFTKVRFFIKKGRSQKALEALSALKPSIAEQKGILCDLLAITAMLHEDMGKSVIAMEELGEAVALAREQNKVRVFLNEGGRMQRMLEKLAARNRKGKGEYLYEDYLLQCYEGQAEGIREDNILSTRETQILRMVRQGAANAEIAQTLFVSCNTVKTHLMNVYTKLDVHSRTEAAAKAEAMHII